MRSNLARLIGSLRLSKRQLALPVNELEALLLKRQRAIAEHRIGRMICNEDLAAVADSPLLRAAGSMARAKFEQMIARK